MKRSLFLSSFFICFLFVFPVYSDKNKSKKSTVDFGAVIDDAETSSESLAKEMEKKIPRPEVMRKPVRKQGDPLNVEVVDGTGGTYTAPDSEFFDQREDVKVKDEKKEIKRLSSEFD